MSRPLRHNHHVARHHALSDRLAIADIELAARVNIESDLPGGIRASPTRPSSLIPPAGKSNTSRVVSVRRLTRLAVVASPTNMHDISPGGSTNTGAASSSSLILERRARRSGSAGITAPDQTTGAIGCGKSRPKRALTMSQPRPDWTCRHRLRIVPDGGERIAGEAFGPAGGAEDGPVAGANCCWAVRSRSGPASIGLALAPPEPGQRHCKQNQPEAPRSLHDRPSFEGNRANSKP